jgi:hypothetical protein
MDPSGLVYLAKPHTCGCASLAAGARRWANRLYDKGLIRRRALELASAALMMVGTVGHLGPPRRDRQRRSLLIRSK